MIPIKDNVEAETILECGRKSAGVKTTENCGEGRTSDWQFLHKITSCFPIFQINRTIIIISETETTVR